MKQQTSEPKTTARRVLGGVLAFFGRFLLFLLVTALLLVGALYCALQVLINGPSTTARDLFVRTVCETSAAGFLAEMFLTDEQIETIVLGSSEVEYVETDTSLIQLPENNESTQPSDGPATDEWGLIDEDGDGIILETVNGEGFSGHLMIVLDPSRVIMGSVPEQYGGRGYTVGGMAEKFGAVASINAGGFYDPDGTGNGSTPEGVAVYDGKVYTFGGYDHKKEGFAGFDSNHILHVGNFTLAQIRERDIQYGVSFGPVLIVNGEMQDNLVSGVNPRTGIAQRSDGAVMLLVIDGRQLHSQGATYEDMAEVFLKYGAVNAYNLDGGSSSMMWFNGEYVNKSASLIGIRPVPTTFLVLPKGEDNNG